MKPHVLIARLDNDGDVLLAGPATRAVAAGAGRVTFLCGPRGRAAADLLHGVDEIVEHRAPWIDPEPEPVSRAATLRLVDRLAELRIDEAFVLTSFHQSPLPAAMLLKLAGVGFVAAISDDYPGSLLDIRHRISDEVHEVGRSLSLVATRGYHLPAGDDSRLSVKRPAELHAAAREVYPYVVVHPGASVPARSWAAERNAALVDALVAAGRRVVVTGGPGETELTSFVAGERRAVVRDLGGLTDLAGLAEVLANASAVVVGNTGPAHLAAAVGTPVVSLYAPTVPAVRWHPWRVPHVLLGIQDIPCAGCRAKLCPVEGHPCIDSVTVDAALRAIDSLLPSPGPAELTETVRAR